MWASSAGPGFVSIPQMRGSRAWTNRICNCSVNVLQVSSEQGKDDYDSHRDQCQNQAIFDKGLTFNTLLQKQELCLDFIMNVQQ